MKYFPVFLNLKNRLCVVVGGGDVAARKITLLANANANILVVSPEVSPATRRLLDLPTVQLAQKTFEPSDLDSAFLVVVATNSTEVNHAATQAAHSRGLPVNAVDQPDLSSFITPAIIDRSPVVVAISTGGAAPVLARLLRSRIEAVIPAAFGKLAKLVDDFRHDVKAKFNTVDERRRFWEQNLEGNVAELVVSGQEAKARRTLQENIASAEGQTQGEVYLVGAGPGDPDLLTFRALRLMQRAEVVLYDRLVSDEIMDMVRRDADRIYVGKEKAKHAMRQEEINQMLVDLAKQGKRVLRLKGGDPFIFGRGGEEIDTLAENGVSFQVVPGITAASGCSTYAGIPLTHRDHAQSCTFVTGHLQDGSIGANWKTLAQPNQTIVIYMGLTGLAEICSELIRHGMSPRMPAALIQQGTRSTQRVLSGTVETLPGIVKASEVRAPTLVIIGEVVKLREKLAWFEPGKVQEGAALKSLTQ